MKVKQEIVDKVIKLHLDGKTSRPIAKALKIGKSTVNRILSQWKDTQGTTDENEDLDTLCKSPDYDLGNLAKRLRNSQRTNNQLRKLQRVGIDNDSLYLDMLEGVKSAVSNVTNLKVKTKKKSNYSNKENAIMEILFSDLQIGKIGEHYNTEIAKKELQNYGEELVKLVEERKDKYNVEKIIFASLGDIVEDHLKHGVQSATSTDSGLAEQMSNAITYIWKYVLAPLGSLNIPIEVVCIAGNHGSSAHKGMDMYKAGLYSYDYVIYTALSGLCEASNLNHVTFNIPEGVFGFTDIYGKVVIYEHGYFNTATEKSMEDQMKKRGVQLKKHVEYFRIGDLHHSCTYDSCKMVLNGAFFGIDQGGIEYSGILGFNSIPSQAVMFHTDEKSIGKNTVKEFISIQVAQGL